MFLDSVTILIVCLYHLLFQIHPTTSQAISQGVNLHCLKIVSSITLRCGRNELRFGINGFSWERLQCSNRTSPQPENFDDVSCTDSLNASCVCDKISPLECITVYRCQSNQPAHGSRVEFVLRNHASCNGSHPDDQFTRIGCGENTQSRYWTAVDGINHVTLKNTTDFESVNVTLKDTFTCFSLDTELYYSSGLCSVVVTKGTPNMTPTEEGQDADGRHWKIVAIVLIVFSFFSLLTNICLCCKRRLQTNVFVDKVVSPVAGKVQTGATNNAQTASDSQTNDELCDYTCLNNKKSEKAGGGYTALLKHNAFAVTRTMCEPSRRNFASTSADYQNQKPKATKIMQNVEPTTAKTTPNKGTEPQHRGNSRPSRPNRPARPARPGHHSVMESSGTYEDIKDDPSPGSRPATYLDIEESDDFTYDYTDDQTGNEGSLANLYDSTEYANDSICRKGR